MGMRNMKIGGGLALGGMALSGIASNMAPGAGADTVGVLGQTAAYAGMGMMFGPIGAGIGALVGLTAGLFSLQSKADERAKAEEVSKREAEKKTQDLMEQLSVRPIALNVSNDTIGKWNTYSQQNGANSKLA